jgi:O-antigen/teichoic acid export membrane protein
MRLGPRLDWPNFREVIRIGLPLSAIGYIYVSLWMSLEGTFVLEWYGKETLGLFAVAATVRMMLVQLAQNMNQVMSVKIFEQYGRSERVADCVRMIFKPITLALLVSLPAVVVGWIALPWAVQLLIPKYVGAVAMMRVMLLALPLTFLGLPMNILWATGRKIDCLMSVIVGFAAFAAFSFVFWQLNFQDLSVPLASTLGQVINVVVSFVLILRLVRRENRPCGMEIGECVEIPLS